MRYCCWMIALMAGTILAGTAQPPRTPHGILWAGTTFELRAIATDSLGVPLSLSPPVHVSIRAIYRWSVVHESPNTLTVSGGEGWFTLKLTNNGNAVDALSVRFRTRESTDTSPWSFTLFEQMADTSDGLVQLADETAPFAPCETRRLLIRAWPPGNRLTDGAFAQWLGISQRAPNLAFGREFAAGVEAAHWAHTSVGTWTAHQIVGEPVLIQGRLHWLTWNGQQLHLFRTPNPLHRNSTFSNNVQFSARINTPAPTHHTVVIGDRWYVLTQSGRIVFFPLGLAQNGVTLNAQNLSLPNSVSANPALPLVQVGNLLGFADQQHRVWVYNPTTFAFAMLLASSAQPITVLRGFSGGVLVVGRSDGRIDVYQGTVPVLQGLRLPSAANQPVRFVVWRDGMLTIAAGTSVGAYDAAQRKWLWMRSLDSALAAEPIHDPQHNTTYLLTTGGWLHGLEHATGRPLPLYPQPLFTEVGVARATMSSIVRADRQVPYLYLQAQLNNHAVRIMFVTAHNPLNRFVFPPSLNHTPIGSRWLFTGNTDQDLALCWITSGGGNDQARGIIYGFLMR